MPTPNAALSGHFSIGGDLRVNRLGFGAMRITGRGIWGPPADRAECIRTLRRLPDLGVNFIDTALSAEARQKIPNLKNAREFRVASVAAQPVMLRGAAS